MNRTLRSTGGGLHDGEVYHADAPGTFWLLERQRRESLKPGDLAKLLLGISVDNANENAAVERMWVLARERTSGGDLGSFENESDAIAKNDEFWLGRELPFSAKYVINIEERDAKTVALAWEEPIRRWPR